MLIYFEIDSCVSDRLQSKDIATDNEKRKYSNLFFMGVAELSLGAENLSLFLPCTSGGTNIEIHDLPFVSSSYWEVLVTMDIE